MSEIDWFADDFKLAEDFSVEVMPLICSVEAQNAEIHRLKEQYEALSTQIEEAFKESQQRIITAAIKVLEADNKKKLINLQKIKECYLAEDLVGTLETLTSAEGGIEISEAACDLMKRLNDLVREAGMEQY